MDRLFREISIKKNGGAFIWLDGSPASLIINSEFFEEEPIGGNIYNESLSISFVGGLSVQHKAVLSQSINLAVGNSLASSGIKLLSDNVSLGLNAGVNTSATKQMSEQITISSGSGISAQGSKLISEQLVFNLLNSLSGQGGKLLTEIISLSTLSGISSQGLLVINQSISLSIANDLQSTNTAVFSSNIALVTNANVSDSNLATLQAQVVYLTNHNIAVSVGQFADLTALLLSSHNLTVSEKTLMFEQVQQSIDNDIIFSAFVECYEQISIATDFSNSFEALKIIGEVFGLSLGTEVSVENQGVFSESLVLNLNLSINFIQGSYDLNYELVDLRSKILSTLSLKSLIQPGKEISTTGEIELNLESKIQSSIIIISRLT
ncbi:MAG: hypothetical protein ACRDBG_03430 [Waterburya sp.]